MATLSELVEATSLLTGVPEATVFSYGRFAREGGNIGQGGRGRGGAQMTLTDAANLLIALCGTDTAREAGSAIGVFRPLKGSIYDFDQELAHRFLTWLKPLGLEVLDQREFGTDYGLKANFGAFLEFLLSQAWSGELEQLMLSVPVAEVPIELWAQWKREKSPNLHRNLEDLIEEGLVRTKAPEELRFGDDLEVRIAFVRKYPRIDVEFRRMWSDQPSTPFQISFLPKRFPHKRHDLEVSATITQNTFIALGLIISGRLKPSALRQKDAINRLFAERAKAQRGG